MPISRERQGEIAIIGGGILWSFFPVLTILSYGKLHPLVSLTGSLVFSALFFAAMLTIRGRWKEIFNVSAIKDILGVTIFIGVLFYGFFYYGLRYTSAGNASIIGLLEVFTSYAFFHLWKKDYISKRHVVGAVFMVLGAAVILIRNVVEFRLGDFLILAAVFFAPTGNYFQQQARKKVSSETALFLRTVFTIPFLILFIYVFNVPLNAGDMKSSLWFFLLNGIILFGFTKILWLEGIHRISVTKANALSSIAPFCTLFVAWIFLHEVPVVWQFLSLIPLTIGVILLTSHKSTTV